MIFRFGPWLLGSGLFLILDRFFKWHASRDWVAPRPADSWFGWQPLFNRGVAFSVPLPNWFIVGLTAPIIALVIGYLGYLIYRWVETLRQTGAAEFLWHSSPVLFQTVGLWAIALGAASNFFDRLLYGYTIDYLRILTGVFNLADGLIVGGGALYLIGRKKFLELATKPSPTNR